LEWHGEPGDDARVRAGAELARAIGAEPVVTNDVHYHKKERAPLQDVLTAIREGTTVAAAGRRLFPNSQRALRSAAEQNAIFQRLLGSRGTAAVERSAEIAAQCKFSLDELRYEYPDEIVPAGETPASHLRKLTLAGAAERYPRGVPPKVTALIEHELRLIAKLRYEAYFLTVRDIVAFARSQNILCQGRGSAANSVVCYCLGVTSVDPARMELLFERFVSEERDEPPDIDIDFEHERREEVIQYVYNKYGRHRAGIAAEVIRYRGRSAVRDVGKAMGLSLDQVDRLAKAIEHWHRADLTPERLREAGLSPDDPNIKNVIARVDEIADFPRHLSQHVGGFVISRGPLCELVPIENAAMPDRTVVQWDKDDLEALGILKVDLLGLGILTATRKSFDLIRDHYHHNYTLATIPSEDPETYEMLCHADAVGVFQVESRAQRAMLPRLRPRRFYDLVVEIAIVRPGPIQGGMVHPYLRRRAGEEPYDIDEHPDLREVLERTHGVPLFQEQVMKMAVVAASFTPGEADQLRRAMGAWKKRGIIERFHEKFVFGMLSKGYERDFAERVFDQIRGFGDYGFPESHAASFALIAYVTAWLKRFYPAAYTAALLNSQPMGFYAPAQLVADAREHGVEVRAVDINNSFWDCSLERRRARPRPAAGGALPEHWGEPGPALRLGMRLAKGLDEPSAARIAAARAEHGIFTSVENCALRANLDKRATEALVAADAFASAGAGRRAALWEALGVAEKPPLFESVEFERFDPDLEDLTAPEQVVRDYESLGLSLRKHPMWFLRPELDAMGVQPASDVLRFPADTKIRVAGIVVTRQRPQTASGVVFVSLEDETGTVNLIVPPQVFERDRFAARAATAVVAVGNVERAGEVVHVKTWKLWEVTQLRRLRTAPHSFH
jgi:error-prone DNA polymerase